MVLRGASCFPLVEQADQINRYPRTWQVIVSPVQFRQVFCALGRNSPYYQVIWTLAACEGGSSPPVSLEFRTVHCRKLFWERLLLSFFLNLYPSRVLHRKWPQCSLWIPGQLQSQQKQVDFKLNKEKAVWATLCFKRCTMWLGLGKDKEAMRDKVSSVCSSWPPLDCPATDHGRERRKQLSPCWLASSPPHFPAWRDTPSSTHRVLSVRDRTHLQWRRAAFKALFGAGGEWQ